MNSLASVPRRLLDRALNFTPSREQCIAIEFWVGLARRLMLFLMIAYCLLIAGEVLAAFMPGGPGANFLRGVR